MKIVYVVPIIAPYAIPRYSALATNKGVEVHIVVERMTNSERAGWNYTNVPGCIVHMLDSKIAHSYQITNKRNGYKMDKMRYFSVGLRRMVNDIQPDVVLVCNSTQIMFLLGPKKYKLGVIVEDTLRAAEGRSEINKILKNAMLRLADFYVPFSADAIEFLKVNKLEKPQFRSYWSMDHEDFSTLSQTEIVEAKGKYGMDAIKNFIVVSSLIPRKGILQFLKAWNSMGDAFKSDCKLFILGDGPLKNEILKFIVDNRIENVIMVGNKSYDEVIQYYQCADIFVLPTLEDLCSLSVLEAMAAGLPVLTTIYNGARQFVIDGTNGYVFDPLDEKSVCNALENIYNANIEEMSKASLTEVKKYATKTVMDKLYCDLREICVSTGER